MAVTQTSDVGSMLNESGVTLNTPSGSPLNENTMPLQGASNNVQGSVTPKDLSSTYANVNGTIYNIATGQDYSNQNQFFEAAGVNSFNGLKFNTNWKPPSGVNAAQETYHSALSGLSEADLNNSSTARETVAGLSGGQTFQFGDGTYDANGNKISSNGTNTPSTSNNLPSNAAYDTASGLQQLLSQAQATIQKLQDPNQFQSLADTYNNLRENVGLPALETQISDLTGAITGTPDDIRKELSAAGGTVTDSQVYYLAGQRNEVLFKQLDALNSLDTMKSNYVNQYVTLTGEDQQSAITRAQDAFSIGSSALQIQDTMKNENLQQNLAARDFAVSHNITKPFYSIGGTVYSSSSGLPMSNASQYTAAGGKGDFSDVQPVTDTTQLQKIVLPDGSTGYWNPLTNQILDPGQLAGSGSTTNSANVVNTSNGNYDLTNYDPSNPNYASQISSLASTINSSASSGTISSAADAQSYIDQNFPNSQITGDMVMSAASDTGTDPATIMAILQQESGFNTNPNAVTDTKRNNPGSIMGATDGTQTSYNSLQDGVTGVAQWLANHKATASSGTQYSQQVLNWVSDIQAGTATIANVPAAQRTQVSSALAQSGNNTTALASRRFTLASNAIVANYISLPQYQLTANGYPYLQRIAAAEANPGSISDQDLLDSLTKLNTAGNAISDAQVSLITQGQSYSDVISVAKNKLGNGGVLSDSQRQQIQKIATAVFNNYKTGYQPVYNQAVSQLQAANIPKQYWTIPDLNSFDTGFGTTGSTDSSSSGTTDPNNYVNSLGIGGGTSDTDSYLDSIGASLQ